MVEHHGIQPSLLTMSIESQENISESPLYKPLDVPPDPVAGSDDAL
jgi:hypothetical protein